MKLAADMHTHTVASTHAYSTITENCRAAAELGLRALAITDHYLAMPDSPHEWHLKISVLYQGAFWGSMLSGAQR